ncbi:low-density lipoprotein receptor class A domain-containing protein 2 isoform X2 [Alosa sapidissima]|uniref:low-density lipoprotein receptor class A domain-containing protein 2 isoform X2 n=1 Tax=Alosa sapidissima TaxID=34773 RepID=UPI001C08AD9B|nr:low-density lipoprotein receptor class A domain-containing protein 2 isoform X2 [Alosa sapidissima]
MAKVSQDELVQHLSKVFAVICVVVTLKPASAIETVNVVDLCGQTIHGDGLIINSHQESKKYYFVTMGTDCQLTIQANMLQDRHVESTSKDGQEDPCYAGSYIQFYDGPNMNSPPIGLPLCGKSLPRPVISTGNYLTLRLVTRGTQPRVDFVGDFTSFRLGSNQSECGNVLYFSCWNGKCIPMSLVCDDDKDIDNCGDGSDLRSHHEAKCTSHQSVKLSPQFTLPTSTILTKNCGTPEIPMNTNTVADSPVPPLALYVLLGLMVGIVLLCWCCWSPGWFLWRVSVCRLLPCCNSFCASCQLCACSCSPNKDHRLSTVSPQSSLTNAATNSISTTTVTV